MEETGEEGRDSEGLGLWLGIGIGIGISIGIVKVNRLESSANCFNADFWGPASNFGIPIAAVMDTQKDPQ